MSTQIREIDAGSPAESAGINSGDALVSINKHVISDVLDYKFYSYDSRLRVVIKTGEREHEIQIEKQEGQELGLNFDTYLIDSQRGCSNKCVFCFIDQLPQNMRSTLYFKDDDARMSFLLGNYISMTNLSADDVARIIAMRISPLNISVHTTNPDLRTQMLGNARGGASLKHLAEFADAGLHMNTQIVVCPGLNDGAELSRTLAELASMAPSISSVAVVPVGLTNYREGLAQLRAVTQKDAIDIIRRIDKARENSESEIGDPMVYAADELYLIAGKHYPEPDYYGEYQQLENGIGMMSMFEQELRAALYGEENLPAPAPFTIATGFAAADFMQDMINLIKDKCPSLKCDIIAVENKFFGKSVSVAGLLTGGDIISALQGKIVNRLLLPECMIKHGETVFLDDVSVGEVEAAVGAEVKIVPVDGGEFFDAIFGR